MAIRSRILGAVLALLALPCFAQDIAGRWNASVDTEFGPFAFVLEFMVDAAGALTGSMQSDFLGSTPIREGMIDGDDVSFKLMFEGGPGGAMTVNYEGTVDGDELALTSTVEGGVPGGGPAEQTFTATRAE